MLDFKGLQATPLWAGTANLARFGGIKEGEHVIILTDPAVDTVIIETIALACSAAGADVAVLVRQPSTTAAERLPDYLATAAAGADVVIDCGQSFSIHTKAAFRAIHEYGTRWVAVSPQQAVLRSKAARGDLGLVRKIAMMVQERITDQLMYVTDDYGTDLTYYAMWGNIGGGAIEFAQNPGTWGVFPAGVCHITPAYDTPPHPNPNGVAYFDAVYRIPGGLAGLGGQPQRWVVEDGWVTEISGGGADLVKKHMVGRINPDFFCEASIGTNPLAEMTLDGGHLFDSRAAGTMHMALGDERLSSAKVTSDLHWDNLLIRPTLTVAKTGEKIIDHGHLCCLDELSRDERCALGLAD